MNKKSTKNDKDITGITTGFYDFDKLTMEVYTNGTISAKDAVGQAAYIAQTYFQSFVNFDQSQVLKADEIDDEYASKKELLNSSIEILDIGTKAKSCLKRVGINLISELVVKTESDLLEQKYFGASTLAEIKEKLESLGLKLGMSSPDSNYRDI